MVDRSGELDHEDEILQVAAPVIAAPATSQASPTVSVGPFPPNAEAKLTVTLEALLNTTTGETYSVMLQFGQEAPPPVPSTWIGGGACPAEPVPSLSVVAAALRAIPCTAITSLTADPPAAAPSATPRAPSASGSSGTPGGLEARIGAPLSPAEIVNLENAAVADTSAKVSSAPSTSKKK